MATFTERTPDFSYDPASFLNDPVRLHALRRTMLLDTPAEESFDRLTRLATKILHTPIALVSLVDHDHQFFKSCVGLPEPWATMRETPLSHSFCQHTVVSAEPLLIEDARAHPLVHDNLAIPDLGVIAYAGFPLITADGQVLGSLCVIDTQPRTWTADEVDILRELTASVVTEIELRLATQAAQEAIREREGLLSIASHELKHPLTSLLGYADLLSHWLTPDSIVRERDLRAIHIVRKQAMSLNTMLDTLLDTARFQSNQMVIEQRGVDLGAVVANIVAEFLPSLSQHTLEYHDPAAPVVVRGDLLRLEQVVRNIIGNAIKYSPDGGQISVKVSMEQDHACLVIQDHGIGIPPDALTRLFQRFERVREGRAARIGGLGLGLYVVKEIVALHGGSIEVSSVEGEGSVFSLCLPLWN